MTTKIRGRWQQIQLHSGPVHYYDSVAQLPYLVLDESACGPGQLVFVLVVGFVFLIFGGWFFVYGSSEIVWSLGVGESVIGLTLVAMGTSLPELATSVVAALKKNPEIAIGNVIGSNLFNVFFVLGMSATITPLPLGGITNVDLFYLLAVALPGDIIRYVRLLGWKVYL